MIFLQFTAFMNGSPLLPLCLLLNMCTVSSLKTLCSRAQRQPVSNLQQLWWQTQVCYHGYTRGRERERECVIHPSVSLVHVSSGFWAWQDYNLTWNPEHTHTHTHTQVLYTHTQSVTLRENRFEVCRVAVQIIRYSPWSSDTQTHTPTHLDSLKYTHTHTHSYTDNKVNIHRQLSAVWITSTGWMCVWIGDSAAE